MKINSHPKRSTLKNKAIADFAEHVSSGKAAFFQKYGMDFVMGSRKGPYLWDIDGAKRLFNLHCNGGVFNLGHRNIELIELLKADLDDYDIGNHHLMSKARADLACKLAELMPGDLGYSVFGVGGGEAVDLAFKVARAYTKRAKIISARGGYHGHTGLALAAGDAETVAPLLAPGMRNTEAHLDLQLPDLFRYHSVMPRLSRMSLMPTRPPLFLRPSRPPWGWLSRPRVICHPFAGSAIKKVSC